MHTQAPDFPFVCVLKSGGSYHAQHVQDLLAGLRRYQPQARLVCLTDLPDVGPGVEVVPLQHNLPGWFSKLEMFALPLAAFLYIDLDVVFTGPVDIDIPDGLWILRGFKGQGVNSSVLLVRGQYPQILDSFVQDRERLIPEYSGPKWGDQDYILDSGCITGFIQDRFPTLAGSWRQTLHYRMGVIADAPSILVFHGKPKPQDLRLRLLGPHRVALFAWTYLLHAMAHRLRRRTKPSA